MYEALHTRNDIKRLFVSKEKGLQLASIGDCINARIQGPHKYITKNKGKLITAASNINGNIRTNRETTKTRKKEWEEK